MVLEVAMLNIKSGMEAEFESVFQQASSLIASMDGYCFHTLHRCLEVSGKYLLLVEWRALEDHTIGFRCSSVYSEWQQLLHHFYDPFPVVEHFEPVIRYSLSSDGKGDL